MNILKLSDEISTLGSELIKVKNNVNSLQTSNTDMADNIQEIDKRLKKLADCFQLEYVDNRYISKRRKRGKSVDENVRRP